MASDPGALDRLLDSLDAAVAGGQWQQALDLCDRILSIDPENEVARNARFTASRQLAASTRELAELPAAQPAAYPDDLTEREVEVLRMLGRGLTNQEIGDRLFISIKTVATHLRHIYEKANVANRAEATAYAIRHGLSDAGQPQQPPHKR